jgi:alcohol dehydrogenase (cytochrome c)
MDLETGYMYVCAEDGAGAFRAWEITDELAPDGEQYIGGDYGSNPMPTFGVFSAVDLHTNKLAWQQHWPERCLSGSVATAGGLVFVGRSDGRLTALDSATGNLLWEFQTGSGMNSTASVFEHRGRQYLAALAGGHVRGGARGDSVWLFSLSGTLEEVPPATRQPIRETLSSEPAEVSLDDGMTTYARACVFCHGADGTGGHGGPAFSADLTASEIQRMVAGGSNTMPSFGTSFDNSAIANVSAWVIELVQRAGDAQPR